MKIAQSEIIIIRVIGILVEHPVVDQARQEDHREGERCDLKCNGFHAPIVTAIGEEHHSTLVYRICCAEPCAVMPPPLL